MSCHGAASADPTPHEIMREDYPQVPEEAYGVAVRWAQENPRRSRRTGA